MEFKTLVRTGTRAAQPVPGSAVQCFYRVDDEGNIIEFSDGLTWIAFSPSVSGGGVSFVDKELVTANTTTVTFSGLDGDTDEIYRLIGRVINNSGSTTNYVWRPNGGTTNLSSRFSYINSSNQDSATLQLSGASADITNGAYWYFTIDILAKKDPDSIAMPRFYSGIAGNGQANAVIQGKWNETATNITSIVIVAAHADGIGRGSTFALYKYAQL